MCIFRTALGVGEQDTVAADIRACVDFARKEFKPTTLGLVGFCFGGGRALEEAAAGNVSIWLAMPSFHAATVVHMSCWS